MAWKERRQGGHRAPEGESRPRGTLDLRLDPADRVGGPAGGKTSGGRIPAAKAPTAKKRPPPSKAAHPEPAPRKPVRKARRGFLGWIGRAVYWSVVIAIWAGLAGLGLLVWQAAHLPPIQSLDVPKRPPTVQIAGLDGRVIATRGEMGGAAVPLQALPDYLPDAFIAIEDKRFRDHFGVDPVGIARAAVANVLRRGVSQGGSTLTQQLAKNLFLTQERTFSRKLQEVVLALWLERKFSKDQILELYLNRVYFGAGAYGVEAAAQRYFGKPARQLTLAESAMLAGLVKSPTRLAPTRHLDAAQRRAALVVQAMADEGYINRQAEAVALARPAQVVKRQDAGSIGFVADYVMDVLDDLVGHVEDDVTVITTLDPVLQQLAERALVETLARDGAKADASQGAMVAMSPDGAVRALVGGRSYADSQFNRAVTARRQPGSAFKPFVYLAALERGLTPDTLRDDSPIQIKGWKPENYTHDYRGPVTLTTALAHSLNTVAVRLALEVGPRAVVDTAQRLGIAAKLEANASIALGTSEVTLLELTSAFAPFANGGLPARPVMVERVRAAGGKTLYVRRADPRGRVVAPGYVGMMNAMLEEVIVSGTGRKAQIAGWQAAGKTGTTQDFKDAWFVGFTGRLVAGVWLGNDDSSPMKKVTGGGLPAEIWGRFMREAHRDFAPTELPGGSRGPNFRWTTPDQPPSAEAERPAIQGPGFGGRAAGESGSLDGWLIDRLFGRGQ
ncbi:transglycosylase domain-containing protein [Blastochloris viridis]|uniref:Multimodular transpeptidase-transglycosylase n=1 Tax=Blastochloris viridis TaxID=1079 RepID=A0A0H5BBD0_BLAVI|nr:penicillin-binding protein 1A [Blastochloris viridis]ALK08331.1 Penicillin-binding protein 2D [Blastochloris viridis]BAR98399.1 multimodular transpeptidase-transglycosylase [Blastochloris viridis]CUU44253.1 Penicillin-binding protein 4 precursor [Blastochloris viridis]